MAWSGLTSWLTGRAPAAGPIDKSRFHRGRAAVGYRREPERRDWTDWTAPQQNSRLGLPVARREGLDKI